MNMFEINLNVTSFVIGSLFFAQSFKFYLCSYLPVFMVSQTYIVYYCIKSDDQRHGYAVMSLYFIQIVFTA